MDVKTAQANQRELVDMIINNTAELPIEWQTKILWMAKGMSLTKESLDKKKDIIEKIIGLDNPH